VKCGIRPSGPLSFRADIQYLMALMDLLSMDDTSSADFPSWRSMACSLFPGPGVPLLLVHLLQLLLRDVPDEPQRARHA
jgi:uncharacterized membrane protein YhdT